MNENLELFISNLLHKNMNFSRKYNEILDKKKRDQIRRSIIAVFNITYPTFRRWAVGVTIPPKRYHVAIANIMGISVAELFPNTEKCSA